MGKKQDRVVHFEMGYFEKERAVKFYETVFGWNTQQMGEDMGGYVVAETGESDEKTGRPKEPGFINGGFYAKTDDPGSHPPSVVISVDDIQVAMKEIEKAGGKILGSMGPDGKLSMEPQMIPGVGLWISFEDTEKNRVSLLQAEPMN
jgi:predicted enzyme related to lactoylglutathione lyase